MKLGKNQIRIIILLVFVAASGIGATSNLINPVSTAVAPTNPAPQSTPQTEQEKILAELTKSIAGKENQNAGEIWKNVQQFKKLPANRFLRLMNTYTKVLGVSCSHCHIVGQWEKEDLQTKQIPREMLDMMDKINTEGLAIEIRSSVSGMTRVPEAPLMTFTLIQIFLQYLPQVLSCR